MELWVVFVFSSSGESGFGGRRLVFFLYRGKCEVLEGETGMYLLRDVFWGNFCVF